MSLELILASVGSVVGILGALRAFLTNLKLKQIEKEKAQPNIDIDFNYTIKEISEKKIVEGNVIFNNIGEINTLINWYSIRFQCTEKLTCGDEAFRIESELNGSNKLRRMKYIQGCAPIISDYDYDSTWYSYLSKLQISLMKQLNLLDGKKIRDILNLNNEEIQKLLAKDESLKRMLGYFKEKVYGMTQNFDIWEFTELVYDWNERIPEALSLHLSSIDEYILGFQLSKNEKKRVDFCLQCEGEGTIAIMAQIQFSPLLRKDVSEEDRVLNAISNCFKLKMEPKGNTNVEDWVIQFDSKNCEKIIQYYVKEKALIVRKKNFRNKEWFNIYV